MDKVKGEVRGAILRKAGFNVKNFDYGIARRYLISKGSSNCNGATDIISRFFRYTVRHETEFPIFSYLPQSIQINCKATRQFTKLREARKA